MSLSTDAGRVIAFDYGERRIGVAVSDALRMLAQGRETVVRSGTNTIPWRAVLAAVEESEATQIVVGDPLNMDGSVGERALATRAFADELATRSGLPVALQDERLSTVEAQRRAIETRPGRGQRKRKSRKEDLDRGAAEVFLQTWLDAQRGGGAW